MTTERDLLRAAYREAGLCVMAYTVGQKPEPPTLLPREGQSYRAQLPENLDASHDMQVMMVLAAGQLCERLATDPSAVRGVAPQPVDTDLASLASAHATRDVPANAIVDRVFARAADVLNSPRRLDAIHSLASALLAQQTIGPDEAVEIIQSHGVRKNLMNLFAARQVFAR